MPDRSNVFYMSFVNSVFEGNRYLESTSCDVSGYDAMYMTLTNCAYGVMSRRTTQAEGIADGGCFQVTREACRFLGGSDHPYSLKLSSPLIGKGLVLDWMADGVDFVGNPRLRDGKVDIGCYQCWRNPAGTWFSFR